MQCMNINEIELYFQFKIIIAKTYEQPSDVVNSVAHNTCIVVITRTKVHCSAEKIDMLYMSHFAYACKMRYPLNLVLESWKYLWFY